MQQLEMMLDVARPDVAATRTVAAKAQRATNTQIAYESDFQAFSEWCNTTNHASLPAAPKTVGSYLSSLWVRGRKRSSVERAMYAISDAHARAGHASPIKNDLVRDLWRSILDAGERGSTRKQSLISEDIRKIVSRMFERHAVDDAQRLRRIRDRAMLLLLYAGALKRDELRTLAYEHAQICGGDLAVRVASGDHDLRLVTILSGEDNATDPVGALEEWIAVSGIVAGPIFRGIDAGGSIGTEAIDRRAMTRAIQTRCEQAGIDPTSVATMSFRTGFVVQTAAGGETLGAIAKHTGHGVVGRRHLKDLVDTGRRLRSEHPGRVLGI